MGKPIIKKPIGVEKRFLSIQNYETILGTASSDTEAVDNFLYLINANAYNNVNRKNIDYDFEELTDYGIKFTKGNFSSVKCSDTYYAKESNNALQLRNGTVSFYFGFYYLPKWYRNVIIELNSLLKYVNIIIIHEEKFSIDEEKVGKFSNKIPVEYTDDLKDYGYSVLIKVEPYDLNSLYKKILPIRFNDYIEWFRLIQLYLHHILRVINLTTENYIVNDFVPKNRYKKLQYPYLEYALWMSRFSKNSGYNLFALGSLPLRALEKFNNKEFLHKIDNPNYRSNVKFAGLSKTYQTSFFINALEKDGDLTDKWFVTKYTGSVKLYNYFIKRNGPASWHAFFMYYPSENYGYDSGTSNVEYFSCRPVPESEIPVKVLDRFNKRFKND